MSRNFHTETTIDELSPGLSPKRPRRISLFSGGSQKSGKSITSLDAGGSVKTQQKADKKMFVDSEDLKRKIRANAVKPTYDVSSFYKETGIWQKIARTHWFENMTLSVIACNALWISIDTDMNDADVLVDAHPVFQIAEHSFCMYFAFEWLVRFMAFSRKRDGLRDSWFVFDSILVGTMVLETWVMNIVLLCVGGTGGASLGNASILRMARLLRLSRMARMVRLFKAMPELLILIKAMIASLRSCFFVFLLLALMMYLFGITFRQLTAGTAVGDQYFTSVLISMHTLWIDGTLLDNPGSVVNALWAENIVYVFLFYLFVLLSALTVVNMLIGVLCEVVSAVAATEKESLTVNWVKAKLQELMAAGGLDKNDDGKISKTEFAKLLDYPEACKALTDIGVDVYSLIDNIDFIFAADSDDFGEVVEDTELTFEAFMTLMLDLRGTNTATVKDIVDLQKFISRGLLKSHRCLHRELNETEKRMQSTASMNSAGSYALANRLSVYIAADSDTTMQSTMPGMVPTQTGSPSPTQTNSPSPPQVVPPQNLPYRGPTQLKSSRTSPHLADAHGGDEFIARMRSELQHLVHDKLMPELSTIKATLSECLVESHFRNEAPDVSEKDFEVFDEDVLDDAGKGGGAPGKGGRPLGVQVLNAFYVDQRPTTQRGPSVPRKRPHWS